MGRRRGVSGKKEKKKKIAKFNSTIWGGKKKEFCAVYDCQNNSIMSEEGLDLLAMKQASLGPFVRAQPL